MTKRNTKPSTVKKWSVLFVLAGTLMLGGCAKQPPARTSVFDTAYTPQHVVMKKESDAVRGDGFQPDWYYGPSYGSSYGSYGRSYIHLYPSVNLHIGRSRHWRHWHGRQHGHFRFD